MHPQEFETHLMIRPWLVSNPTAVKSTVETRKKQCSTESQARTETPNHDVQTNDRESYVQVDLPGVSKENIVVEVVGRRLEIHAKRLRTAVLEPVGHQATVDGFMEDASSVQLNRPFYLYGLNIHLGDQTDCDHIECVTFKDGVLTIRVPKFVKPATRKISVT